MTQWFYISFARPKSQGGFLGATVVQAEDAPGALAEATQRGLNPGGEAQIVPVPLERSDHPDIVAIRNRLADKAELIASRDGAVKGGYHENAVVVCGDCNT